MAGGEDPLPNVHKDGRKFTKLQEGRVPLHRSNARHPGPDHYRRQMVDDVGGAQVGRSANEKVGDEVPDEDSRKTGRPPIVKVRDAVGVVCGGVPHRDVHRMGKCVHQGMEHGGEGDVKEGLFLSRFHRSDPFLEGRRCQSWYQHVLHEMKCHKEPHESRCYSVQKEGGHMVGIVKTIAIVFIARV
jgi:hypothetical protein